LSPEIVIWHSVYDLPMPSLPLPTLLSHALVAFTIEFDNETKHLAQAYIPANPQ
jgi:hypothetical protein